MERCPAFIMVRPVRTSPGRGGLARGLPEVLGQVRLVGEAAPHDEKVAAPSTASAGFHKPAFSTYKRTLMPVV